MAEWLPSEAAIDLIKLNDISDDQMAKALAYLKNESELKNIDDVDGYDNWNSFFIMFCIKANKKVSDNKADDS